jgi:alkylation response protein AidB-like acyl-CoA dehydrogenase
MTEQAVNADFRTSVRDWLSTNFPKSLAGRVTGMEAEARDDVIRWRDLLAGQGWGAPTWPKEYGGAGLSDPEGRIIADEMSKIGANNPISMMSGMGITMVGPTLLEYGTDDQKARHLPSIANGKIRWCLGLSEPNAGSDLASLTTKAVDDGDYYTVNGQKTWTSGANISQWCGVLVRTDSSVKKRDGISFLMMKMDQPGITTKPIPLIAGASPFCETFMDDAQAGKNDLLGSLNGGWSVIKRLLQHERQSQTGGSRPVKTADLQDVAKEYVGTDESGALADPDLRIRLANHLMDKAAHGLTIKRITAEAKGKVEVSAAASILKNSATNVAQTRAELTLELMGSQGIGWQGDNFTQAELGNVREWLGGKAMSIYGGSFEVQNNIISKNILGLPETTQQG